MPQNRQRKNGYRVFPTDGVTQHKGWRTIKQVPYGKRNVPTSAGTKTSGGGGAQRLVQRADQPVDIVFLERQRRAQFQHVAVRAGH